MALRIIISILLLSINLLCYSQSYLFTSWEQDAKRTFILDTISSEAYLAYDSLFVNDFHFDSSILQIDTTYQLSANKNNNNNYEHHLEYDITPSGILVPYILLITDQNTHENVHAYIRRYAEDVHHGTGCGIKSEIVTNANYHDIKELIISHQQNLMGAVLIGNIDAPFYKINKWSDTTIVDKFPCDLYYMDLDGEWIFDDNDTIIDHTTNARPEIFVARISAEHMNNFINPIKGLKKYFDKNHNYWIGKYDEINKFALAYTDKDWAADYGFSHEIRYLYNPQHYEACQYDTLLQNVTKTNYLQRIKTSAFSFVQLACHSSYNFHRFHFMHQDIQKHEIFGAYTYPIGYNLFCCSACKWIDPKYYISSYIAGCYLLGNSKTLVIVGSTKTGSMLNFMYFYLPLAQKRCIGKALLNWWWTTCGNIHNDQEKWWHNGMVIIGDPMIQLNKDDAFTCQDTISIDHFETSNQSNLHYYRANSTINVCNYMIPIGTHVIFDAPNVNLGTNFSCPLGATFEIRNNGCK